MPSLRLCRAQTIFRRRQHDLHSLRLEIAIHTNQKFSLNRTAAQQHKWQSVTCNSCIVFGFMCIFIFILKAILQQLLTTVRNLIYYRRNK